MVRVVRVHVVRVELVVHVMVERRMEGRDQMDVSVCYTVTPATKCNLVITRNRYRVLGEEIDNPGTI